MKRNMVPLFAIAFVVAIICTGVWYGLFAGKLRSSTDIPGHSIVVAARDLDRGTVVQPSDLRVSEVQGVLGGAFSKPEDASGATLLTALKADEPLLQERVTPRVSDSAKAGGQVPSGMRAVSMHIFQSESVLNLLQFGSRVDLQAVSDRNGGTELRTILENVQVLSVSAADANGNRPAGAVVTVLIRAQDTDMVALADSGSRIRVALRNPLDQGTTPQHPLALAALFSGGNKAGTDALELSHAANLGAWEHPVQLRVRVLNVSDTALAELRSQLSAAPSTADSPDDSWRVAAFRSSDDARKLVQSLERRHELEVVSKERLMAGVGRPISYHDGLKPYQFRVQFAPEWLPTGKLGLRVKPQISVPGAAGAVPKQYDAGPPDTSSFLGQVFPHEPSAQNWAGQLFPGHSWEHKHLVIFVSTLVIQQSSAVAVASAERGH